MAIATATAIGVSWYEQSWLKDRAAAAKRAGTESKEFPVLELAESLPLAAWSALHIGALLAVCLSRLAVGARVSAALQLLATAGFFSIAGLAVVACFSGGDQSRLWILSGLSLGAMVIAAVAVPTDTTHDPVLARFAPLEE